MEIILPTEDQTVQINELRQQQIDDMFRNGSPNAPLAVWAGPCATDSNRHEDGELAAVRHIRTMADGAEELPNLRYKGRKNGTKPRTRGGTTGLIHQRNGVACYGEGAQILTDEGIGLVAEIMDESDAAVASPWLVAKWGGARNVEDTGVRQLLRPTSIELEQGIVPAPGFVKSGTGGSLTTAMHALHTVRAEASEIRTRFTLDGGLQQIETHANPSTGLILRGYAPRPAGPTDEILADEIITARELIDSEFGAGAVALYVDVSHQHAAWEGGGEEGQLAIAQSLARLMGQGIVIDGVLAETYLHPGNQRDTERVPGLSQVDKCIREERALGMLSLLDNARGLQIREYVLAGAR
ncbi:MAG TPA: hypothetical protein VGO07_00865 [Candidatus Saccharimonadales bacterium]|jgi:phospho-2-dehydro-3-deoxyheptonate aldolase|nr:hypothetical protein [Candidatus Saccharimonadales bacterium]